MMEPRLLTYRRRRSNCSFFASPLRWPLAVSSSLFRRLLAPSYCYWYWSSYYWHSLSCICFPSSSCSNFLRSYFPSNSSTHFSFYNRTCGKRCCFRRSTIDDDSKETNRPLCSNSECKAGKTSNLTIFRDWTGRIWRRSYRDWRPWKTCSYPRRPRASLASIYYDASTCFAKGRRNSRRSVITRFESPLSL